jgi:hypothetical protein
MAILNYTTTVPVDRTVAEVQRALVKHGARAIQLEYDDKGAIQSLKFGLMTPAGVRGFVLPANVEGVWQTLARQRQKGQIQPRFVTREQAARVAWRIVKDWVEAQLAIIESGQITADQALLSYMVADAAGRTVYELMAARQFALPPAAER